LSIVFAQGPYTLSFNLSQFEFSVENAYDRVKGIEMSVVTDTGAPELPVKSLNFILPNGKKVQGIEVLSLSLVPLSGTYNIYPTQPPRPFGLDSAPYIPFVPPDTAIYYLNALYPDSTPIAVMHEGSYDGIPVTGIAVYPLLYNPVKDSLYLVQSVTFRFTLEATAVSVRPQIRGERIHQLYLNGLRSSVYNQWEVDAFYTPPYQIIPDDEKGRLGYPDVIIIAPRACTLAYRPLANWLTEKGMFCIIKSTAWVYQNYDGIWDPLPGYPGEYIGDDAAKIKEYLRKMYLECGTPFAVLGGVPQSIYPENYFPFRYCNGIPSDLYLQDFTGEWMNNPDYHEEIWIGRVPAWNYDQASWWVEKRLTYEKSPANRNLMTHSLWITQGHQPDCIDFEGMMNGTKPYFPPQFIYHQVVNHPSNANDHRLIDTLSIGYGIVSTYGHGGTDGIRTAYPDYRQLIMSWPWVYGGGVMPNLSEHYNVNKYYIVYAINCDNAWYDDIDATGHHWSEQWTSNGSLPCIAEAWTSFYRLAGVPPDPYPPINAVAFLGNTRSGWVGEAESMHRAFINRLFYYDTLIGKAEAKSRYVGSWHGRYVHNLFGSPEMPVWTQNPKDMTVEHPDAIPTNTPINFEVTVYEDPTGVQPIPLANALITLYKPGIIFPEVYESESTNVEGKAYFSVNVSTTGVMKVTVTKHNYIPYQGDVQVFEFLVDMPTGHTEYSEGRKLVRQPNTENLNLGFTWVDVEGGINGPDDWSAYNLSTDGGTSWPEGQNIQRFARNPSIGLTTESSPRPYLAFRNSPEPYQLDQPAIISFARYDEPIWVITTLDSYPCIPGTWYPRVSPPSIRIDANNIVHTVYSGVLYLPDKAYVIYKRFDAFNPTTETVIIDSATVPEDWQPSSPSIDLQYGYPHIVYDFPPEAAEPVPEIWYKCLTETGWSDPVNISNSYNNPSLHPFISLTNEKAIVVWSEEETPSNAQSREIYKAERFLNQPPSSWTKWKEIETPNQASDWPVITANDRILVWSEHQLIDGKKNWEVLYHSDIYGDGNLSNTPYTQSRWSSCDWRQTLTGIYLFSAFTEEYESEANPYIFGIKTKRKSLQYIPIPLYTIYAGSETPSPYLVQRDGYIAYENYPVDYSTNELIYKFTGLNPDMKYWLDITAYHESGGEWREWVEVDNTAQHLIKYDAGIPKTVEVPVPPASYMNDGEIIVRIPKISGDFASIHKGNLYGFEKEGQGGPQTLTTIPQNLAFGLQVMPSIVSRNALLRYTIPAKQKVSLKFYDVVGREVMTFTEGIVDTGIHSYNLNTSSLSAGIYFLVLEGKKETKSQKVLVVR